MKKLALFLAILTFCMSAFNSFAQIAVPFKSKTGDSTQTVYIWHSDTLRELRRDSIAFSSPIIPEMNMKGTSGLKVRTSSRASKPVNPGSR